MEKTKTLVINLGSTSTKVGIFQRDEKLWVDSIVHDRRLLETPCLMDQYGVRARAVADALKLHGDTMDALEAVVSRGGILKPVPGGVYQIGRQMLEDTASGKYGVHPCNLACHIAHGIAEQYHIPALIVDPPATDEPYPEAVYSGLPEISRVGYFQALNHRAIARRHCKAVGTCYENVRLIVVHFGGGISVAAHEYGKVTDVNNALDGDGPFAPERTGGLPSAGLLELCYSGRYTRDELYHRICGGGGLRAYLGITDGKELETRIQKGDRDTLMAVRAMAYQVAKEIGAMAAVMRGKVDAILFTGGMAHWERLMNLVRERVEFIAQIFLYPGEDEMQSLAEGAARFLRGEEVAKEYR